MIDARHDRYLWHYTARATDLRPVLAAPSGRVVGGSSAINTTVWLWALRGHLDAWATVAGPTWSYERCVPYFQRLETDRDFPNGLHGRSGPIPVERPPRGTWSRAAVAYMDVCLALGYPECRDFNHPDAVGIGPVPLGARAGERVSTAVAYLAPARARSNLTILARSCARRIVFAGTRATAVEVATERGQVILEADEIVLSAGAIGSPHLLLLSGVGPADEIAAVGIAPLADLRGVGRNLRNHPLAAASWRVAERYGPAEQLPIPWQTQLRCTAPGSSDREDACLGMAVLGKRDAGEPRIGISTLLMHASSVGSLRLATADPDAQPAIDLDYLAEADDRDRMRSMIGLALELGAHPALDGVRGELVQPTIEDLASARALDDWLLRSVLTSHHPCGTCRMGPAGEGDAVVDEQGRVHGLERLRVVDASIMPDCPRVNINATTMMLAEKIADVMRGTAPLALGVGEAVPTVRA